MNIYFMHDALTPGNVRFTWNDAPQCPAVGEYVAGDFGYEGARVSWKVKKMEWADGVSGRSATCYMTGWDGKS